MPVVELHATACVRQHLSDHTFELEHLFLGHARSCFARSACAGPEPCPQLNVGGLGSMTVPTPPTGLCHGFAARIWAACPAPASENGSSTAMRRKRSRSVSPCAEFSRTRAVIACPRPPALEGGAVPALQPLHDLALHIIGQKPAMAAEIGGDLALGPALLGTHDGLIGAPPQGRGFHPAGARVARRIAATVCWCAN